MTTVLISGYGDIGQRVARRWRQQGAEVIGLRRRPGQDPQAAIITIDLDQSGTEGSLPAADIVYHFAAPPNQGVTDPRLENLLQSLPPPQKLVLISTSAVYGDCAGAWVDEETPPRPQTERGTRRVHAERTAQHWCKVHPVSLVILRVPGIYGPGRLPLERLKQGLPVVNSAESPYTNRIHSEDLAEICLLVGQKSGVAGIYNVSDGNPGRMTDYFNAVADVSGLPRPPQITLAEAFTQLSPGLLSYLAESRRLDNRKLLRDTGVTLLYPDLAKGLVNC